MGSLVSNWPQEQISNTYAKKGHEPSYSNQAQGNPLGLPDLSMEYRKRMDGMRGVSTTAVAHWGPQSSHHSANKPGLESPA